MTRKRRGLILVLTIWVLVLIVAVALGLSYEVELDTRAALNADAQTRAYYAAYAGIERAAAELDQAQEYFSAPGQSWEVFDSDQEPLSVEAEYYRYRTLVSDDCSRLDLNTVDNAALTQIGERLLDEDQIAAILQRQAGLPAQTTGQTQSGAQTQNAGGAGFQAVDDLLLIERILPQQVYGVGSWIERLSPADRFRQQWVVIQQGQAATAPPPSGQPDAEVPPLVDLFTAGSAARRLASDGMPRVSLATITREEMQDRLNALNDSDTESASSNGEFRTGGGGGGSPVSSALGVLQNRNISNWSEVWGAVGNNRDAVRLLADILTLPNSGGAAGGQPGTTPDGGGNPGGGGAPGGTPGGGGGPPGGGSGGGGRGGALWLPPSVRLAANVRQSPRVVSAFFSQPVPRFLLVQGGAGAAAPSPEGGGAEDPSAALPQEGPINLNTASPAVLSALPQMTEAAAQAIVSYRETTPFRSRGDLLRVPEVPQNVFSAIVERVTVLSDRFTVRSLGSAKVVSQGTGRESDLAVHLTATLDRTTGRCRIVRLRQDN